ncbi:MAG: ZIP family metal transporter [Candidatus Saccharibacteria bacterium]|nr:ZIP family metal transporter [Candidatus Saccharibacteria bacterium]
MHTSIWIVLCVSLAGDFLVFFASTIFLTHKKTIAILTHYATPFAAGALLSAAFLDFLHDGVEHYEPLTVLIAALVGILFFFLLEGWLHWFHHHSHEPFESKKAHTGSSEPVTALAVIGNLLHNFIDGAAIAAAFLISPSAGVITTVAVALHEIPREIADSGYLLQRGMDRIKIIGVHGAAVIVTAIGTVIFYQSARSSSQILAWLIGSTAGFFIYVAASDIIPSINQHRDKKTHLIDVEVSLVILGAVLVGGAILLAHHFIPV